MNIKSKKILAQLSAVVLVGSAMTAPIAGMAEDAVDTETSSVTVESIAPVVKATPAVETPSAEAPVVEAPAIETPSAEAPVVEAPSVDVEAVGDVAEQPDVEASPDAPVHVAIVDGENGGTQTSVVYVAIVDTTTTTTTTAPPPPDYANMANGWGYAYKDFIENDYIAPAGSEDNMHFALVYLDGDDIPELILSEGDGDGQTSKIFRFTADGKVEEVGYGTNFGSILYSDENNLIYNVYNEKDVEGNYLGQRTEITKLVDGELKTIASFYNYKDADGNTLYKINGVTVTAAEYARQLRNYKVNIPVDEQGNVIESQYDIGSILNKDIKDVKYTDMIQVNSFTKNLFQHLLDNASANSGKPVKRPASNNNTASNNTSNNSAPAASNNAPAPASAPAAVSSDDASPETGDNAGKLFAALALSAGAMVATKKRKRS